MEQEARAGAAQEQQAEIRYDAAVMPTFATNLPETLRADDPFWKEILQEVLQYVRSENGERAWHPPEIAYRRFPGVGFEGELG